MSATDPNMAQWMNPAQPTQPQQPQPQPQPQPQTQPQPAQPASPFVQAAPPVQPPVQAVQQWFMNPQTQQNELYELNTELNQWVPVQQAQPQPIQPPPVPAPAAPPAPAQPQYAQQPAMLPQQPQPGIPGQQSAFPAQPPVQPPVQPMPGQSQPISISQQMELEQMRQANAQRSAGTGTDSVSLKMSLKGVTAGNFNLVPVDLVYESKITKAEVKLVDAKTHYMIVFNMVIVFPNEYRGTMLRNNINLTEESLGFYRAALEACDLFDYQTEEPTLNSEQEFVGKIVRHSISHREWKGEPRNNVNGAFSKAFESDEAKALNGTQQPVPAQPFAQQPQATPAFAAPPAAPAPAFAPPTGYTAPDSNGSAPSNVTQPNFG